MSLKGERRGIVVTIGLCVKNSEATIEEAVRSIIGQEFPLNAMELIIVDGCSNDHTLSIINKCLAGVNLTTKRFSEKMGLGHARQIVVENAQGEFILWVDGDMVLSNDFVAEQVRFMRKHSYVGIAKGRYGNYRKVGQNSLVATLENVEFMVSTSVEGATNSKSLGTAGCIYRTEALIQSGGFDPEIRGVGEDMDAENRIRKSGWQIYITSAVFFETRRQTWQALWKEYYWHGRGGREFRDKRARANLYKMIPPVALVWEALRIPPAYRLTRRKIVLLLPVHYLFKRVAWVLGLINA